jgi:lipopolysaccharide transport system ATP-binding protein
MSTVSVKDLVVEFPIYGSQTRSLKNTFINAATGGVLARDAAERVVVRALNDISFELHEGDRVGLVGHNGSGKSTLLRVLTGAYEPARGSVEVDGRIASMLSITLGMDTEATGYENIFVRAAIMGMTPKEIAPLVPEIIEFSELGDYIRMPFRTYSSGMAMRLAFAISTSVPGDIILMDEWLSVGDSEFSQKATQRLAQMLDQAKVFVLASHDEALIHRTCNKLLRLDHGRMVELRSL